MTVTTSPFQAADFTYVGLGHLWSDADDEGNGFLGDHHPAGGERDPGFGWVE